MTRLFQESATLPDSARIPGSRRAVLSLAARQRANALYFRR